MVISTNIIDGNQIEACKPEAIDIVLKAMETHINNADVCEQGCYILRNITSNGK